MRESAACQDCLLEHAENVGGIGDGGLKRFWTLDIGKCHFGCFDVWLWSVSRFRGFASSVHPAHHLTSPPWPLPPRRLPHSSLHPTTLAIPIYQRQHSPSPALLSIPRRYCSSPSDSPRPVAYTHTHAPRHCTSTRTLRLSSLRVRRPSLPQPSHGARAEACLSQPPRTLHRTVVSSSSRTALFLPTPPLCTIPSSIPPPPGDEPPARSALGNQCV